MLKTNTGALKFTIFSRNTIGKEKPLGIYKSRKKASQWFRFFVKRYGVGNVFIEKQ